MSKHFPFHDIIHALNIVPLTPLQGPGGGGGQEFKQDTLVGEIFHSMFCGSSMGETCRGCSICF